MKPVLSAALALAACLAVASAEAQTPPQVVGTKCQACHGAAGNSADANIPRLNGQHAEYLVARLKSFLDPGGQDPHATDAMWGVVREVDDATLAKVAAYYAAQAPTEPHPSGKPALIAEGKRFFAGGNAAERIQACQACHGTHGEGAGAVPRLGGQHGAYLKAQLERLRLDLRSSDTMHPKTNSITDREIDALVAYLAND